jgi:Ferritin-like
VTGEQAIVVEHRKELTYLLSQAAELEHSLMAQYLFAAFSLRTESGPGLTEVQLEAVERWRSTILAISAEEMLHWALVQNLLIAVGSAPYVSRPHMPHQAKGYPPGIQLRLLGFGDAALQHFVYLERPEGMDMSDGEGFVAAGPVPEPMAPDELQPRGQHFTTQGYLYRAIEDGIVGLAARIGEERLFIGPRFHQSDAPHVWPELVPITDVGSARRTIERIVEQGEGARGDWATAHYGRFLAVLEEYKAMVAEDPAFRPAHPAVAAGVRGVEGIEPDVYITDRVTAAVSDAFNAVYDLLLQMIARYFAFGHETDEQRHVLADVGITLMFIAIKPLGFLLARMPASDDPDVTAGANFQLAYRASFLLPHRRSAWFRFSERLDEIADALDGIDVADDDAHTAKVLDGVATGLRDMSSRLTEQIEPV